MSQHYEDILENAVPRLGRIIDDMAATLLEITHADSRDEAARMAHEAIERWKAATPWPRLNDPNPPPKPMPGIDF